jgi:hypothetical protein
MPFANFAETETRFRLLIKSNPARAKELFARAEQALRGRYDVYEQLSHLHLGSASSGALGTAGSGAGGSRAGAGAGGAGAGSNGKGEQGT